MERTEPIQVPQRRSALRSLICAIPTLLVFLALAAVGAWGHRTGWKAPKFDELLGRVTPRMAEDWCTEHNVPGSRCLSCHPELAGESMADWCKEHGVPESKCTACHPEILTTGIAGDWCKEHGVPESGCTICHAEIAQRGDVPPDDVEVVASPMDSLVTTSEKPNAGVRNPATCQTHALRVQFASAGAVEKAGVHLGTVIERPMAQAMSALGQVEYDATRYARVSSRVLGVAWTVDQDVGSIVEKGDLLAIVESAEVGRAKADFLEASAALDIARNTLDRIRNSTDAGFRTEAERQEAAARVRQAEVRLYPTQLALANLGLPEPPIGATDEQISLLGLDAVPAAARPAGIAVANLVALVAPLSGVVVARNVVASENVRPGDVLFEVADLSRMAIVLDVPGTDVARVALGQSVAFWPDDSMDASVNGVIDWIATALDETTRTVRVRAVVDNPDRSLRAHAFGRAQIVIRSAPSAIVVPREAVQWEGCCHVVFVRLAADVFQTRKVRLGSQDAVYSEVLVGLLPGEVVVTTGSHVLRSEILKSSLGAGCCAE